MKLPKQTATMSLGANCGLYTGNEERPAITGGLSMMAQKPVELPTPDDWKSLVKYAKSKGCSTSSGTGNYSKDTYLGADGGASYPHFHYFKGSDKINLSWARKNNTTITRNGYINVGLLQDAYDAAGGDKMVDGCVKTSINKILN